MLLLSLLGLALMVGRVLERVESLRFAAKTRQDAMDKHWQTHEDRHATMERRWDDHLIRVPGGE